MMFGYSLLESILASRIDFGRSKKFLLSTRITFKGTTKYKSFYLKINSNQINSNKINSAKIEPNTLLECLKIHVG